MVVFNLVLALDAVRLDRARKGVGYSAWPSLEEQDGRLVQSLTVIVLIPKGTG